ncbi:MAG: hypothetical protein ACXV8A_01850 [Chthoniobacterales bacterium]
MIAHTFLITIFFCASVSLGAAANLTPLSDPPAWSSLEKYQGTMTHAEFVERLQDVYCTRGISPDLLSVDDNVVRILESREQPAWFTLRFAENEADRKTITNGWRPATVLPRARAGHELAGLKIALDPGHIGGTWAKMEERWFQVGDGKPVQEGDMTLLVAKLLAPKLQKLGATVSFVRDKLQPTTSKRPDDLKEIAREVLRRELNAEPRENFDDPADPEKEHTVRWQSELFFYRNSEIRARARRVNTKLKPDIALCLHFNAEAWDDPRQPRMIDRNHLHLLVNGSYLPPELEFDDVRFEMLRRLLSRTSEEELPLAEKSAIAMARKTQLPPYEYTTDNVTKLGRTGYVVARNLLATRLYQCPVVYFEPYVMNSDEVFWRVQEGDYEGIRNVNGTDRPSIFREYADGVFDGLVDYYREARQSSH